MRTIMTSGGGADRRAALAIEIGTVYAQYASASAPTTSTMSPTARRDSRAVPRAVVAPSTTAASV